MVDSGKAWRFWKAPRMLLAREFVAYLSRQVVKSLTPLLDTAAPGALVEVTTDLLNQELEVEDKLNEEVRDLLDQYSDYMREQGVSYSEMFRKIKSQLVAKKKIVRASGRESGDQMKLSRDKITDISHKLVAQWRKSVRGLKFKKDPNEIRLEIIRAMTTVLQAEEKADRASRDKVRTLKRGVAEGSEEFDLLQHRYYAEELKRLGIDV